MWYAAYYYTPKSYRRRGRMSKFTGHFTSRENAIQSLRNHMKIMRVRDIVLTNIEGKV